MHPFQDTEKTADLLEEIKKAAEFGIENCNTPHCNMGSLIARKEEVVSAQAGGILALLKKHRVNYITGSAYIPAPYRLEVTTSDGSTSTHQWDNLILATGSRPAPKWLISALQITFLFFMQGSNLRKQLPPKKGRTRSITRLGTELNALVMLLFT